VKEGAVEVMGVEWGACKLRRGNRKRVKERWRKWRRKEKGEKCRRWREKIEGKEGEESRSGGKR